MAVRRLGQRRFTPEPPQRRAIPPPASVLAELHLPSYARCPSPPQLHRKPGLALGAALLPARSVRRRLRRRTRTGSRPRPPQPPGSATRTSCAGRASSPPSPFDAEPAPLPERARASSTIDSYRDIRFRRRQGAAGQQRRPVPHADVPSGLPVHPPGDGERDPRRRAGAGALFGATLFDYGRNKFERPLPVNLGFAGFRLHYPLNDPQACRRADLVPRRELFPLPRPQAALRPVGARPRDRRRREGDGGVPGLPRVLDRAARARMRSAPSSTRCSTAPSVTGAYQFLVYPADADRRRRDDDAVPAQADPAHRASRR